jgi:CRISPR-associated protein Csb1
MKGVAMGENQIKRIDAKSALEGPSPLVLQATLRPVAGMDRFQPAGFPEIGHVIYPAPREDGTVEYVCIVDSAASMANHLESVCLQGPHDLELADDLAGMPCVRCVTGDVINDKLNGRETIATTLTEGHRLASTYFLEGKRVDTDGTLAGQAFKHELATEMGIVLDNSKFAHPPPEKWWSVFETIFRYDPNALVHGVMFPRWQIKIPRLLTAHLEAFGASRVERSGVKFDRLGKTTSGQPIFAVDDETAHAIRATFILDIALARSFGRTDGGGTKGLTRKQQEFLVSLGLWKIHKLLQAPFRFRSGCYLEPIALFRMNNAGFDDKLEPAVIDVNIKEAITQAEFKDPRVTDVYWERNVLYEETPTGATDQGDGDNVSDEEDETEEEG